MQTILFFLIEIILLFLFSQQITKEFFFFFRIFIKNEKLIYYIVTFIFFPGTVIHEMAHFLAATICMLKVKEVTIFPEFKHNYLRLGSVVYEKKDFIRGIIVGIAPFFMGLVFFFVLSNFKLFPNNNLLLNVILGYLVFAVSSTMFSSKQDLVDMVYLIPLILVIWFIIYLFDVQLNFLLRYKYLIDEAGLFLEKINFYLLFSISVNLILFILLKVFRFTYKK